MSFCQHAYELLCIELCSNLSVNFLSKVSKNTDVCRSRRALGTELIFKEISSLSHGFLWGFRFFNALISTWSVIIALLLDGGIHLFYP